MLELLKKIYDSWALATGYDPTGNSIQLGMDGNFQAWEAKRFLEEDSTGVLTILNLRGAFQKMIKEHKLKIEDILNSPEKVIEFQKLKSLVMEGECNKLWEDFLKQVIDIYNGIGITITKEELNNINDIEKTISSAFKDFKKEFKHEKFSNGIMLKQNSKISTKLFRFSSLEKLVSELKNTLEDNFICLSIIDTIQEESIENINEDSLVSYAFGVKNNGVIYIVSDRPIFHSPEGNARSRNPYRDLEQKWSYGFMPYEEFLKGNLKEQLSNNQLLLTYNNNNNNEVSLKDLINEKSLCYIALMFWQLHKKYFVEIEDTEEVKYFSNQVKLLSHSTKGELVIKNDSINLPSPVNIKLKDVLLKHSYLETMIESETYWDRYIQRYPLPEAELSNLKIGDNFLGTPEEAQKRIWWDLRNKYYYHIKTELEKESDTVKMIFCEWFAKLIPNRLDMVIDFILKTKNHKPEYICNESVGTFSSYKEYTSQWSCSILTEVLDNYTKKPKKTILRDSRWGYSNLYNNKYNHFQYYSSRNYRENSNIIFYQMDEGKTLSCTLNLKLRDWDDFKTVFGITEKDLPEKLQDEWYLWRRLYIPYQGNSLLDFTDPMTALKDPLDKLFKCSIEIWVAKKWLNKNIEASNMSTGRTIRPTGDTV